MGDQLDPLESVQRLVLFGTQLEANNLELAFIGMDGAGSTPYHAMGALRGVGKLTTSDFFARFLGRFDLVLGAGERAAGSSVLPSGTKFVNTINPVIDRSLFPGARIVGQEGDAAASMVIDVMGFWAVILELRLKVPTLATGSAMSKAGALYRIFKAERAGSSPLKGRCSMRAVMAMACAVGLSCAAAAQDVVVFGQVTETRQVEAACHQLFGADCPRVRSVRELVQALDGGVTLAVIEWYFDLPQPDKELLLPALERHIDRGGRLLLAYTELDEWPELQDLVGVRTIGEVTSSLGRNIWATDPPHPIWSGPAGNPMTGTGDYWDDNGDFLEVRSGYVLARWDIPTGPGAMALTRHGRIFVNGFDLDGYDGEGIDVKVAAQIEWLLSCSADLDGDGELTFFDFLAFQSLFVAGDRRADFAFDGQLDFIDFLEFQEQFSIGCP